jgi:hypothetical protein
MAISHNYQSNVTVIYQQQISDSVTEMLKTLKDETDGEAPTRTMEKLYKSLIDDAKNIKSDESMFDFVMEDGFKVVAEAIRQNHSSSLSVHQGFSVLFAIADDTPICHWRCIWDSLGGLCGAISLLEDHRMDYFVVCDMLFLLSQTMEHGILLFEAKEMIQWLILLDLLLEGVENNLHEHEVCRSLCHFLRKRENDFRLVEMHQRIIYCLSQGIALHTDEDETCQSLGQTLLFCFAQEAISMSSVSNEGDGKQSRLRSKSKEYCRSSYCRCAAAA